MKAAVFDNRKNTEKKEQRKYMYAFLKENFSVAICICRLLLDNNRNLHERKQNEKMLSAKKVSCDKTVTLVCLFFERKKCRWCIDLILSLMSKCIQ